MPNGRTRCLLHVRPTTYSSEPDEKTGNAVSAETRASIWDARATPPLNIACIYLESAVEDHVPGAAVKDQLLAEIILLTHSRKLHKVNLAWHPRAEELP